MAEFDIVVRNGTIGTASAVFAADIGVKDGRIVAIGEKLGAGTEEVDATGRLVLPGGVDSHTHIDEPRGGPVVRNIACWSVRSPHEPQSQASDAPREVDVFSAPPEVALVETPSGNRRRPRHGECPRPSQQPDGGKRMGHRSSAGRDRPSEFFRFRE